MRLKCLITSGFLDISSQEPYQGTIPEMLPMRLTMRPGQIVELQDEYRNLKNIDSAIKCGLLQVLDYDSNPGSLVVNDELERRLATLVEGLIFQDSPIEAPNGINKTFTLPSGHTYISGKIFTTLNGQVLGDNDVEEVPNGTQIVFKSTSLPPRVNDEIRFYYIKRNP